MEYFVIGYKNNGRGESGEDCKSTYDLTNACETCGTGAELIGKLKVKGISGVKKELFQTLSGDILISKGLYVTIKKSHSNFELTQVINTKDELLDFYHFTGYKILPKVEKDSAGLITESQCQTCKRNGYFSHAIIGNLSEGIPTIVKPLELKYRASDIKALNNEFIVKTWECIGLSNKTTWDKYVIRYARPLTIVNEQIKIILDNLNFKDINYTKIVVRQ